MKNRMMTTNIGTIDLAEIDVMDDGLDVFIPVVAVSESLKATIEECTQKAKEEYQREFLDGRGEKWSDAGIFMAYQNLHIIVKNKLFTYELCFDFEDAEDKRFWTGFNIEVDLSEHTAELKKLIVKAMIDKFF